MKDITVVCNLSRKEYFFAKAHSSYNLGSDWVPITFSLPRNVAPRPECPDGVVDTLEKYKLIFHYDEKEVAHPRPDLEHLSTLELYRVLDREKRSKT